jgi:archaellum component FlaC
MRFINKIIFIFEYNSRYLLEIDKLKDEVNSLNKITERLKEDLKFV